MCSICTAIKSEPDLIQNTVLFESERFVLLPTIGPLVAGHAMLASKVHYESLGEMGSLAISEFKEILKFFKQKFSFFSNVLITEHGSYNEQKGGACIVHTHIHLIPGFSNCFNILDDILPTTLITDLLQIENIRDPYILNMNCNNEFRLYEAYNSYSQIVRKAICKKYNRNDSDWSIDPKNDLIEKTISFWKN